jgi:hypothetical protein
MSAVARIRAQIAQEHAAALQGLNGLACVASHEAITARMERYADRIQRLIETGRETEARALLFDDQLWQE